MKISALRSFRSPLGRRIVLYTILFSSLITLILTVVQLYRGYKIDLGDIENHFELTKQTHLDSIREAVWATNKKSLRLQLEGILQFPDMIYAEIREEGKVLVSVGKQHAKNSMSHVYPLQRSYRGMNLDIGTLKLEASLDGVYQRVIDRAAITLLSNGVKTFLVAIFALFVFYRLAGRHILHIADAVSSSAGESEPGKLQLERKPGRDADELDYLTDSINRMQVRVDNTTRLLRESEARYRTLFDLVPVAIWVEDFSEVWQRIEELREQGIKDLGEYFEQHPGSVAEIAKFIRVIEVNKRTLELYESQDKEGLERNYQFSPSALDMLCREIVELWNGRGWVQSEHSVEERTLGGKTFDTVVSISTCGPPFEYLVLSAVTDITSHKRMERAAIERANRLEGLVQITAKVAENIHFADTFSSIGQIAANLMDVDAVGCRLIIDNRLMRVGTYGIADRIMIKDSIEVGQSLSGLVVKTGKTLAVPDVEIDARVDPQHRQAMIENSIKAFLGVPLFYQGKIIGALNIYGKSQRILDEESIRLFQAFADHAAIAIEKSRLHHALEAKTMTLEAEVSERRRLVDQLSEREKQLRLITDSLPVSIAYLDRGLHYRFANRTTESWFQRPREEILGRHVREILGDATFQRLQPYLERALQGKGQNLDTDVVYPDGGKRHVNITYVPRQETNGNVDGVYAMVSDITDRKHMEDSLRVSQFRLNVAMAERERLLRDLHDGILQTIYAIGLGLEEVELQIEGEQADAGGKIAQEIDRLNRVIRDLRKHITGGKPQALTTEQLRAELKSLTGINNRSRGIGFRVDVEPIAASRLTPSAAYDVVNIAREALSNCIRHSRASKGAVTLRLVNSHVRLIVEDDGVGFDPEAVSHNGNGLQNIRSRASRIGGRLEIDSESGRGTRVMINIPAKDLQ